MQFTPTDAADTPPGHTVSLLQAQIRGISPLAQALGNSPLPRYSLSGLGKDGEEEAEA